MRKEILLSALLFAMGSIFAQYKILLLHASLVMVKQKQAHLQQHGILISSLILLQMVQYFQYYILTDIR